VLAAVLLFLKSECKMGNYKKKKNLSYENKFLPVAEPNVNYPVY